MYQPPEAENLSTMNIKASDIGRRLFRGRGSSQIPKQYVRLFGMHFDSAKTAETGKGDAGSGRDIQAVELFGHRNTRAGQPLQQMSGKAVPFSAEQQGLALMVGSLINIHF